MLTTALASLAFGGLGALEWRRLARRTPALQVESALRHARHLIAAIPIALALLAAQLAVILRPEITWSVPVWLELRHVELLLGAVVATISFLFGFATWGAFATRHRQRAAAVVSAMMLVGIVLGIEWECTTPIARELHDRTSGGVVFQSSSSSCAAASAANLARHWGVVRTEAEMAELLGTTRFGTSPAQVIHGLGRLGFSCRKTARADGDAGALRLPAMLFLPPSPDGGAAHAVLLAGVEGQEMTIIDPLRGRLKLTRVELGARWKGHAVECAHGPATGATGVGS